MGLVILIDGQALSYFHDRYDRVVFDTSVAFPSIIKNSSRANHAWGVNLARTLRDREEFATHARVIDELEGRKDEIHNGAEVLEAARRRVRRVSSDKGSLWRKLLAGLREVDGGEDLWIRGQNGTNYADFHVGSLALLYALDHEKVAFLTGDRDLNCFVQRGFMALEEGNVRGITQSPNGLFTYTFRKHKGRFVRYDPTVAGTIM